MSVCLYFSQVREGRNSKGTTDLSGKWGVSRSPFHFCCLLRLAFSFWSLKRLGCSRLVKCVCWFVCEREGADGGSGGIFITVSSLGCLVKERD
ncbi:hypothetical protein A4A49_37321 [Nicotiana attenuata]|uniref:Uncharacterized protein n=1 Tax=Nicotiana attenuata TaxID=49451 RepID=A0A1J6IZS1_NICAT|nr:hypothetical protein A4A49_37321 [Nicotiana attenuata]